MWDPQHLTTHRYPRPFTGIAFNDDDDDDDDNNNNLMQNI
jgi:hypothetical protein